MTLNLQHLRYFWTVAQEGSITRACDKLCLTQSTVSGQIIQFEKAVKARLFDRQKNRLALTGRGRMMFRYANRIFGATQELEQALDEGAAYQRIRVRLGIEANISNPVLLECMDRVYALRPDASVTVYESDFTQLVQKLDDHEVDLVIHEQMDSLSKSRRYCHVVLARFPIFFIATARWARVVKVFPRDLRKVPMLLPIANSPLRQDIERYFARANVRPQVFGQFTDTDFAHALALKGYGAAPAHKYSMRLDPRTRKPVRLGKRSTGIHKTLCLLARNESDPNPLIQDLLEKFRL